MGLMDQVGVIVVGPSTPYVSPDMLLAAPTGISWSSIGGDGCGVPTQAERMAEVSNICSRASAMADSYCNTVLRATLDSETLTGPGDFRFQMQRNGRARLLLSRWPVLSVVGGQWSPSAAFPAEWTQISADMYRPERPLIGTYGSTAPNGSGDGGQAVLLAPGIVSWSYGRGAYDVETSYINGWPHCSMTEAPAVGATQIHVDDITGWLGATGVIKGNGSQEAARVTAVTPDTAGALTGPGVLTLSNALYYEHPRGTIFTTMSGAIEQAVIMLCVSQALIRGATATTVQALPGTRSSSGTRGPDDLIMEAKELLAPYKRVI